jgi:hypothetical protein
MCSQWSFKLLSLYSWERAPGIHWIGGWVGLGGVVCSTPSPQPGRPGHRISNPQRQVAKLYLQVLGFLLIIPYVGVFSAPTWR